MASKNDVYAVLEAIRVLGQEVTVLSRKVDSGSGLSAEVADLKEMVGVLTGKLEEVAAGIRDSAAVLQELKVAELRDRLDMLDIKFSMAQVGDVAGRLFQAMKSLEKPEWLFYIEIFGAGFHQPFLAMVLLGAAAAKGNPFWMLLACFASFFLSPYLTVLWVFFMLVLRCGLMRKRCMKSIGCGGSPSSKRSSRNSNRDSTFLSSLRSRLPSVPVFPMPSFSSFTAWRTQRSSASTTGNNVESPQAVAGSGEGEVGDIALADFAACSSSTPIIIAPSSLIPDPPSVACSLFSFPPRSRVETMKGPKEHIV
jgi:hypothetical protein